VIYIGTTNNTAELAAYITGTDYPVWPSATQASVPDAAEPNTP
jgi:hypothetical protein